VKSIFLSSYQTRPTVPFKPPCQIHGMDMSKKTRHQIEAQLRLLADLEREELTLLMRERWEAEREGGCSDD
jgi:hypothetical protein